MASQTTTKKQGSRRTSTVAKDITRNLFSTIMPVTANTAKYTKSAANDFRAASRNFGASMRQQVTTIDKTVNGKSANKLFQTAMKSIGDGSFGLNKVNDEMFNDFDDIDKMFSMDEMTAEERAEKSPEEIILGGSQEVAQSVIRAGSAQLEGMVATSTAIIRGGAQANKALATSINSTVLFGVNAINSQIMITNSKLDLINENLSRVIEYNNENTTTFYEKNLELMGSMSKIIANMELANEGNHARDLKNFDTSRGFDPKAYLKRGARGIKNGMMGSMFGIGKTSLQMMSPTEVAADVVKMMLPKVVKEPLEKFDKNIGMYFDELLKRLADASDKSFIGSMLGLGEAFGNKRRTIGTINMGDYMKDALPWNGKAQRALTEVIPELLTSIDAGINKTDKRYYDYNEGKFSSRTEVNEKFLREFSDTVAIEIGDKIDALAKVFENAGESAEKTSKAKDRISTVVQDRIHGNTDVMKSRDEMAKIMTDMNVSQATYVDMMRKFELSIESINSDMNELYKQIGSTDSIYRNINNRSGDKASRTTGREAYRSLSDNKIDLFEKSIFSEDTQELMDRLFKNMQEFDPEFKATPKIRKMVVDALHSGASDTEILRSIKNYWSWNRPSGAIGTMKKKIDSVFNKNPNETAFGKRVQQIDADIADATFGGSWKRAQAGRTRPVQQTTVTTTSGSGNLSNNRASSRRSNKDGVVAGAKFARSGANTDITYQSDPAMEKSINDISAIAGTPFSNVMKQNENKLNFNETVINRGSEIIDNLPEDSGSAAQAQKNLMDTVRIGVGSMVTSFTNFGARLFGKQGLISKLWNNDFVQGQFKKLKDYLFDEKKGIFRNQVAGVKKWGKQTWEKTKDHMANGYDWVYRQYMTNKFGTEDYEDLDEFKNNEMYQKLNWKKNREAKKAKLAEEEKKASQATESSSTSNESIKDEATREIVSDINSNPVVESVTHHKNKKSSKKKGSKSSKSSAKKTTTGPSKDDLQKALGVDPQTSKNLPVLLAASSQEITEATSEAADNLKTSMENTSEALVGDPNQKPETIKKQMFSSIKGKFSKMVPKALAGGIAGATLGGLNALGGASLLGSMFLPGGPIGGAIVGGGLAILSQTEAFKSVMFGKLDEKTGNRSGGIISEKMRAAFKKAAPIAVGGAVAGALKSIIMTPITGGQGLGVLGMQILPGGILGGALLGMGVGLLKNSETFKKALFGEKNEKGERSGKFLSNAFNKAKGKMAGMVPGLKKAATGLGVGALTGAVLSNMGYLPAMLSMGGPVGMGVIGLGVGIAASTKKFNEWMFGTEEFDEDGNPTGKHKGGILTRVRNLLYVNVIEPISTSFRNNMLNLIDWTKDKITLPFRTAFGPILDSIRGIKDNVVDFVKDKFEEIGEGIKHTLTSTIKALFSPVTKVMGFIGKSAINMAKIGAQVAMTPVAAGLGAVNLLTMGKRRKEYGKFYKNYYAKGNINNKLNEYWDAQEADAAEAGKPKKIGFLQKTSDRISAWTGRGPIADAAREGYNEEHKLEGKNSLGWRGVAGERRKLKEDRKERNAAAKKWNDISKLTRRITNRDLGGRDVELNDARFQNYKKKFTKLGISEDLLTSSDDMMELLYHTGDFRRRAAGKSGKSGDVNALSAFRETPEQTAAREKTSEYQTNVTTVLNKISEDFGTIAKDLLLKTAEQDYTTERKHDMKRLKKKSKLASKYNKEDWKGHKIDFDDPELNEYDISDISTEDLQEYRFSEFYTNNDFKGWLAANDRSMVGDKMPEFMKIKKEKKAAAAAAKAKAKEAARAAAAAEEAKKNAPVVEEEETPEKTGLFARIFNRNKITPITSPTTGEGTIAGGNPVTKALNTLIGKFDKLCNINAATLEATTGGEVTADDVEDKKGKSFGSRIMNKFSIFGTIGGIFKKKQKDAKAAARSAREAEESKAATALDGTQIEPTEDKDKKEEKKEEEKKSVLGGIFSSIGGSIVGKAIKTIAKLGLIALPGIIGMGVLETLKPGTTEKVKDSIIQLNNDIADGSIFGKIWTKVGDIFDSVKTGIEKHFPKVYEWWGSHVTPFWEDTIKPFFTVTVKSWVMDTALPFIKDTFLNIKDVVLPAMVDIGENFVKSLPVMASTIGDFMADHASAAITGLVDIVSAIATPLIPELIKQVPNIVYELGLKMPFNIVKSLVTDLVDWVKDFIFGRDKGTKTESDLDHKEAEEAKESGLKVRVDNSAPKEYVTGGADAVQDLVKKGVNVQYDENGEPYLTKYSILGSRVSGTDENGNEIIVNDTDRPEQMARSALSIMSSLQTGGLAGKVITGTAKGASKIMPAVGKVVGGAGKFTGGVLNGTGKVLSHIPGTKTIGKLTNGLGNFVKTITNPKEAIAKLSEKAGKIGTKIKDTTSTVKDVVGKVTGKSASVADDVAEVAAKNADGVFAKMISLLKGITTNKTLVGIVDKFKGLLSAKVNPLESVLKLLLEATTKLQAKCTGKAATSILSKITAKLTIATGKAGATTFPLIGVVTAAWGVADGALSAANLFEVAEDDVDWKMRLISAIMEGLASISIGCIIDIVFELVDTFVGIDVKHWLAVELYKLLSLYDKDTIDALVNSQANQETEREIYNIMNNTNLDSDAYNDKMNKSMMGKIGTGLSNAWKWVTGNSDKIDNGSKDYTAAVNALTKAGYTKDDISKMSSSELSSKVSSLTNGETKLNAVGYGPGPSTNNNPYSQANSKWANTPIGTFANGQTATMGTAGCGPTAMATVLSSMKDRRVSPELVGKYAAAKGYITNGGANAGLFTVGARSLGLDGAQVTPNTVKSAIASGAPTVISGKSNSKSSPFTKAGHIVVSQGLSSSGKVLVTDPADGKLKSYSMNQITSGMNTGWAYKNAGYGPGADTTKKTTKIDTTILGKFQSSLERVFGVTKKEAATVTENIDDAKINALLKSARRLLTSIASNPVMKRILTEYQIQHNFSIDLVKLLMNEIVTVLNKIEAAIKKAPSSEISSMIIEKLTLATAKATVSTIPIFGAITSAIGFGTGTTSDAAAEIFHVAPLEVDWKMRLISSLLSGLTNISIGYIVGAIMDISLIVFSADMRSNIAVAMYKALPDDTKSETLASSITTTHYSKTNGIPTKLLRNVKSYNLSKVTHKSVLSKMMSGVRKTWSKITLGYGFGSSDRDSGGFSGGGGGGTRTNSSTTTTQFPILPNLTPRYSQKSTLTLPTADGGTYTISTGKTTTVTDPVTKATYAVTNVPGYYWDPANFEYKSLSGGSSVSYPSIMNHTASFSTIRYDARAKQWQSRTPVNGVTQTYTFGFGPLNVNPKGIAAINQANGNYAASKATTSVGETADSYIEGTETTAETTAETATEQKMDKASWQAKFLDPNTSFVKKLILLGNLFKAGWDSYTGGESSIWDVYNNSSSTSATSTTGDIMAITGDPKSAAEELLQKTIAVTTNGESGGDYSAVNKNDGATYSIGITQANGGNAAKILQKIKDKVTGLSDADKSDFDYFINKANSTSGHLTDSDAKKLKGLLSRSDILPAAKIVENAFAQWMPLNTIMGNVGSMYDSGSLFNAKNIVIPADILNSGPAHFTDWRDNWNKNRKASNTAGTETDNVINSLKSSDSYWGRQVNGKQQRYYKGWMNRIGSTGNTVKSWSPKYAATKGTLVDEFSRLKATLKANNLGFGYGPSLGFDGTSNPLNNVDPSAMNETAIVNKAQSGTTMKKMGNVVTAIGTTILDKIGYDINGSTGASTGTATTTTTGDGPVAYDPTSWVTSPYQGKLVDKLKSIRGTIQYSLKSGEQNPDIGKASCASTCGWAYRKVLGPEVDKSFASKWMSAGCNEQRQDDRFTTIARSNIDEQGLVSGSPYTDGSGISSNILQPGDLIYYRRADYAAGRPYRVGHVEMYAGNNERIGHGSGMGPKLKSYSSDIGNVIMARRYNGFLKSSNSNLGYGSGPTPNDTVDSLFMSNVTKYNKDTEKSYNKQPDHKSELGYGFGAATSVSAAGTENRLDKILEVVGQWYLESKNNPTKSDTTTTNNIIDASTKVVSTNNTQTGKKVESQTKIDSKADRLRSKFTMIASAH